MAQINLLKQNTHTNTMWQNVPSLVVKFLVLVALALVVYYGWVWYQTKKVNDSIETTNSEISGLQTALANIPGQEELWTRQGQLKELSALLSKHPNWIVLLPALAKATQSQVSYVSIDALTDGTLTLSATVPTMDDLDRFLQIFERPEVYQNFSNVKLGSISKIQVGNTIAIRFDLKLKYSTALLNQPLILNR